MTTYEAVAAEKRLMYGAVFFLKEELSNVLQSLAAEDAEVTSQRHDTPSTMVVCYRKPRERGGTSS